MKAEQPTIAPCSSIQYDSKPLHSSVSNTSPRKLTNIFRSIANTASISSGRAIFLNSIIALTHREKRKLENGLIGSWLGLRGPFFLHGLTETVFVSKTALILVGGKLSVTHQNWHSNPRTRKFSTYDPGRAHLFCFAPLSHLLAWTRKYPAPFT